MAVVIAQKSEIRTRVRYSETDQMGVVYHPHYLVWFNMARDELFRQLGTDIYRREDQGYLMPVVEAYCKYHFPARYGDEVIITAMLEQTTVAKFVVYYEIVHSKTKRLLADGKTVNVIVTSLGRLLTRVPAELKGWMGHRLGMAL